MAPGRASSRPVEVLAAHRPLRARTPQELAAEIPDVRRRYAWVLDLPLTWARDLDRYLLHLGRLATVPLDGAGPREVWQYLQELVAGALEYFGQVFSDPSHTWEDLGRLMNCWKVCMDVMVRHRHYTREQNSTDNTSLRTKQFWDNDERVYADWKNITPVNDPIAIDDEEGAFARAIRFIVNPIGARDRALGFEVCKKGKMQLILFRESRVTPRSIDRYAQEARPKLLKFI